MEFYCPIELGIAQRSPFGFIHGIGGKQGNSRGAALDSHLNRAGKFLGLHVVDEKAAIDGFLDGDDGFFRLRPYPFRAGFVKNVVKHGQKRVDLEPPPILAYHFASEGPWQGPLCPKRDWCGSKRASPRPPPQRRLAHVVAFVNYCA